MKALVIGGNRFFGKRLVSLLLDQGVQVTVLNRRQRQDEFGNRVLRIPMDRSDLKKDHPALQDKVWDVIYDQVCYNPGQALKACEVFDGHARKYIFTSSQSVYGAGDDLKEAEFDPRNYQFETPVTSRRDEDYAEGKRQAEAIFFQRAAFPVAAVRFPIVLGEDDYTERLKFHVDHIKYGQKISFPNLNAKISLIESGDAAKFLDFCKDHEVLGPVNCCSPDPIELRDLVSFIEVAVKKPAKISYDPDDGDLSPFGVEEDWYMNSDKVRALGFVVPGIGEWLPGLVRKLS